MDVWWFYHAMIKKSYSYFVIRFLLSKKVELQQPKKRMQKVNGQMLKKKICRITFLLVAVILIARIVVVNFQWPAADLIEIPPKESFYMQGLTMSVSQGFLNTVLHLLGGLFQLHFSQLGHHSFRFFTSCLLAFLGMDRLEHLGH